MLRAFKNEPERLPEAPDRLFGYRDDASLVGRVHHLTLQPLTTPALRLEPKTAAELPRLDRRVETARGLLREENPRRDAAAKSPPAGSRR